MRFSQLFGRTLRDAPAEADMVSHILAVRAGLVRLTEAGGLAYLPLGLRVAGRLTALVRVSLEAAGGLEIRLPHSGPDVAELARREVESYRQLPRLLFHFPIVSSDDARPGGGLLRLRESSACEVDSLCLDDAAALEAHRQVHQSLIRVFDQLRLPVAVVEAEAVPPEGEEVGAYAFVVPHAQGPDRLLRCGGCGYVALAEIAVARPALGVGGDTLPLEKVATPDCHTIADLARYLGIEERQTLKAVFYARDETEFVFVVIRGDLDVSAPKLRRALGGGALRPATDAEIRAVGAAPGYASPAGLNVRELRELRQLQSAGSGQVTVVADPSIEIGTNFAAGANEAGYHFVNVNYPRDFGITLLADIAQAAEGQACARCGGTLVGDRSIVLARTERPAPIEATALDANGRPQPLLLGAAQLDLDRLLAAVIETHHDEAGIVWPATAAPFDVHLVSLLKSGDQAERLYADLRARGVSVLYDDRAESAGVKFADADLIGCPVRLTVSDRSLKAGGVEMKRREAAERSVVPLAEVNRLISV